MDENPFQDCELVKVDLVRIVELMNWEMERIA